MNEWQYNYEYKILTDYHNNNNAGGSCCCGSSDENESHY
jgi:hypothetical protein